jgi:hypothetical protein
MVADSVQPGPVIRAGAYLLDLLTSVEIRAVQGIPNSSEPSAVYVWPLALVPEPDLAMSVGRPPLRLRVRFLLCPTGTADEVMGQLDRVLSVLADTGPEPSPEPVEPSTWDSIGVPPRAAVLVEIPVSVARPSPIVPRVMSELVLRPVPLRPLAGRVVAPGGLPLAGFRVEAVGTGVATDTDPSGGFAFAALPAGDPIRLRLTGRGLRFHTEVAAGAEQPVVIECQIKEG